MSLLHRPQPMRPERRGNGKWAIVDRLIEQYFSLGPAASICNPIVASFAVSTNITQLARSLSADVDSLLLATNDAGIDGAFAAAELRCRLLTAAIFTELNKTKEIR